jgi:hypothetical protein
MAVACVSEQTVLGDAAVDGRDDIAVCAEEDSGNSSENHGRLGVQGSEKSAGLGGVSDSAYS